MPEYRNTPFHVDKTTNTLTSRTTPSLEYRRQNYYEISLGPRVGTYLHNARNTTHALLPITCRYSNKCRRRRRCYVAVGPKMPSFHDDSTISVTTHRRVHQTRCDPGKVYRRNIRVVSVVAAREWRRPLGSQCIIQSSPTVRAASLSRSHT